MLIICLPPVKCKFHEKQGLCVLLTAMSPVLCTNICWWIIALHKIWAHNSLSVLLNDPWWFSVIYLSRQQSSKCNSSWILGCLTLDNSFIQAFIILSPYNSRHHGKQWRKKFLALKDLQTIKERKPYEQQIRSIFKKRSSSLHKQRCEYVTQHWFSSFFWGGLYFLKKYCLEKKKRNIA